MKRLFLVSCLLLQALGCSSPQRLSETLDCGFFTISYPESFVASTDGLRYGLKGDFAIDIQTLRFQDFNSGQLDGIIDEIKARLGGKPESYGLRFGGMEARRLSIESSDMSRIAYVVWSQGWIGILTTASILGKEQAGVLEQIVFSINPAGSLESHRQSGFYDTQLFSVTIPEGWTGRIDNHASMTMSYQELSKGVGKLTVYVVYEPAYNDSSKWVADFQKSTGWKGKSAKMPIGNAIFTTFKNVEGNLTTRIYCSIRNKKIAVISHTTSTPEIEGMAINIAKGFVFK